jgi:hypothetical protein
MAKKIIIETLHTYRHTVVTRNVDIKGVLQQKKSRLPLSQ